MPIILLEVINELYFRKAPWAGASTENDHDPTTHFADISSDFTDGR